MDAKKYLQRLKYLKQRIKRIEGEIETIQSKLISNQARYEQRLTQSDYSDRIGDRLAMIDERYNTLKAINHEYCKLRAEIESTLKDFSAHNPSYSAILAMKYIDDITLRNIADKLHYTPETVQKYHGVALQILEDLLQKREQEVNQAAALNAVGEVENGN